MPTLNCTPFLPVGAADVRPSRSRICFAAISGCWPGRALPTSGCPQPGRPRSGCALGPFVPHAAHAPMGVSRTASRRLRSVFARGRRWPGNSNLTRTYSDLKARARRLPAPAETPGGLLVTRTYSNLLLPVKVIVLRGVLGIRAMPVQEPLVHKPPESRP